MTTGTKVSLAVEQGTGRITLDGPERRNALDARAAGAWPRSAATAPVAHRAWQASPAIR